MAFTWVSKAVVLAARDEQLAEHGGLVGLRDEGLLDSALARPLNLVAYGSPDVAQRQQAVAALAASYAFGLARNHAFMDGNKRISLVICETFLALNGHELDAGDREVLAVWLRLADGSLSEEALAEWIRQHLTDAAIVQPDGEP